jgi:hypothetical protein
MSQEIEATKRVRDTLDFVLKPVLEPFVEANMKARHGNRWLQMCSRSAGAGLADPLDVYGLCKTILDNWQSVFGDRYERKASQKVRRLVSTVFDARNAVSHLTLPISDADALTYLHAMVELAQALKASEAAMAKLNAAYGAQRTSGLQVPAATVASVAAPARQGLELTGNGGGDGKTLKPWVDVALPHPDVIANRFKEAEFAADLSAVDTGHATDGYATPVAFYGISYLTEGLRRVLTSAVQRLAGGGGDPVIGLQTSFGGGKTHTMLAIYHLARHLSEGGDPNALPGLSDILDRAGVATLPVPKIAVFVGSAEGADVPLRVAGGPRVHTLWGYVALRIAGQAGLDIVAEAEAARTNPGSKLLVDLFKLAGPSVILLDELTVYARQLEDLRFEALLSFIHSLTEAAKQVPGILIVGSLPESNAEAGGDRGIAALKRLEPTFGRVQTPWLPASGDETYEIVRRRLFQPLDSEGERARDETVKAFHDLYRRNQADFPPAAREARYLELLRLSYPIHPDLFDLLSKEWASLEKFQRTRGVLRFMANVIGVLWHARSQEPLILPGRLPVGHDRVRASILYPLPPAFAAVVDREVDGDGSLPAQIEAAKPTARITRDRAMRRAARAVFLATAPQEGAANVGITNDRLRLACAEPGDQLSTFVEAVDELARQAAYLYEEAGRYWFSTQPTLNRLADDRARAFQPHEVDQKIAAQLTEDAKARGLVGFTKVHAAPDDPVSIDEAEAMALVILGPKYHHVGKGVTPSPAVDAVTEALTRCRSSQRRYRNNLVFVAPDQGQLDTAREVVRKAMAWRSIVDDARLQESMTRGQSKDAEDKVKSQSEAAAKAIRAAWSHVIYPIKSETAGTAFDLENTVLTSRDRTSIPAAVYDKVKADSLVKERLGPEALWSHLEPIWPADRPHLPLAEVAGWFGTYPYLPKLRDRVVLDAAVRDAVASTDPKFGCAAAFDEGTGKYADLTWGRRPPDVFAPTALIVRANPAKAQLAAEARQPTGAGDGGGPGPGPSPGPGPGPVPGPMPPQPPGPVGPKKPKRFYGSIDLDTMRPVKAFEAVVNAVVLELQRNPGAKVKLTLEVEAEAADGFEADDVAVVRDNAKQLRFRADATGFED